MDRLQTATTQAQQTSVLATNTVLRNTYILLSLTLLFSAVMAGVSMALNVPPMGLITLLVYFGLLFGVYKTRNSAMGLVIVFALTGFLFTYRGHPVTRMLNSGWKRARVRAGLPALRVHDLEHTFGRRLRAAGVSIEDRQDSLGHKSGWITTHYGAAEISNLIDAAHKITRSRKTPALTVLNFAGKRASD